MRQVHIMYTEKCLVHPWPHAIVVHRLRWQWKKLNPLAVLCDPHLTTSVNSLQGLNDIPMAITVQMCAGGLEPGRVERKQADSSGVGGDMQMGEPGYKDPGPTQSSQSTLQMVLLWSPSHC